MTILNYLCHMQGAQIVVGTYNNSFNEGEIQN